MPPGREPWNHNTRYHRALLRWVPYGTASALDIGCGDGTFAARLASRCAAVVALDPDGHQVEQTRQACRAAPNVTVVRGDFVTQPFEQESFDVVTALASLHHMPFETAVDQMIRILRPGGTLIVLGLWTDRGTATDLAWNLAGSLENAVCRRLWGPDEMTAPAASTSMTLPQTRHRAADLLPGVRVRRHALWRYVLVWRKPASTHGR